MPFSLSATTAPPNSGCLTLGRTLPSLLDEAQDRYSHPQALNHWRQGRWQSMSHQALGRSAENFALGLEHLGLQRGDRQALIMHSDGDFAVADLGTLLAGVVNVPIDLTQTIENILFILRHTQAKALVVSNLDLLYQILPYFGETPDLQTIIVAEVPDHWEVVRQGIMQPQENSPPPGPASVHTSTAEVPPPEACLYIPHLLCDPQAGHACPPPPFPQCMQIVSLAEVQGWGQQRWSPAAAQELRAAIQPQDLATLIYIASHTKRPKGVMLTHENITANVLAAFSSYPHLQTGPSEVALLFLPLTHIFARVFLYGHLVYGHSIYLSDANHLAKHLRRVQPTIMITVPRLLEKVRDRILDRGQHLGRFDRAVFRWAVKLAQRFDVEHQPQGIYGLQLQLADRLVFARWRQGFGDRLKACICGGAALQGELTQFFGAAGIPVFQGYGLTETSGVLAYNRGQYHRAGTVGVPIPGVNLALAPDGEVLVQAPFVMQGYYRDPTASHAVLRQGWLHTGDLGEISEDGFLTLTGVKKPLFKLSTGKYVSLRPLEEDLMRSPLIAHAVTVGANHKFCGMLIFPDIPALQATTQPWGLDFSQPHWQHHPRILALYQTLIDSANCHLPYWSTVRQFVVVTADLTQDNGLLLPNGRVNRVAVMHQFAAEIRGLYGETSPLAPGGVPRDGAKDEAIVISEEGFACPIYARSLMHH